MRRDYNIDEKINMLLDFSAAVNINQCGLRI